MKALSRLGGAAGRNVHGPSVQLFDHPKRSESRAAARAKHLEPPALVFADVRRRDVEQEGDPRRALELREERVFDRARAATALHVRGDPNRIRILGQPEREVEQRDAVLEKRAAARLGAAEAPAVGWAFPAKRAGAHADDASQARRR